MVKSSPKVPPSSAIKKPLKTPVKKNAGKKVAAKAVSKAPAKKVLSKPKPASKTSSKKSKKLESSLVQAIALHHQGKLREAWAKYQKVIKESPDDFVAVHSMGLIAIQMKNYQMASDLFKIAIAIEPNNAMVYNNMANAYLKLGNNRLAQEHYDQALILDASYLDALKNRAIMIAGTQQYSQALVDLNHALNLYPETLELYSVLASVHIVQGANTQALAAYEKACAIDPKNPILQNNIGVLLCTLGRYEEAVTYLTEAIGTKPSYAEAFNNRAVAYMNIKQYKEAIRDYDMALTIHPHYQDALQGKAKALLETQKSKVK